MTIKNLEDNNYYSTTDTALAAWLYSQGFELVDVKADSFPSIFFFENSSSQLAECARQYECGKAEGNILVFFRAYKKLLRMIKEV